MQLYFVQASSDSGDEEFFKVGITKHSSKQRFAYGKTSVRDSNMSFPEKITTLLAGQEYISDFPYQHKLIHSVNYLLDGDAQLAEQELLKLVKSYQYWPKKTFSGRSECFKSDKDELIQSIIDFMDKDSQQKNNDAPSALMYKLHATFTQERDPFKKHQIVLEKCRSEKL